MCLRIFTSDSACFNPQSGVKQRDYRKEFTFFDDLMNKLRDNKKIVAYKAFYDCKNRNPRTLRSNTIRCEVDRTRSGFFVSDRRMVALSQGEVESKTVDRGIHVFLKRREAEEFRKNYPRTVVVRLECCVEDFVAIGYNNDESYGAVFMKVKLIDPKFKRYHIPVRVRKNRR